MRVNFPIYVPDSDYCWQYITTDIICEHYNNEGGHSTCDLNFYGLKKTKYGVLKAPKCANLNKIDE